MTIRRLERFLIFCIAVLCLVPWLTAENDPGQVIAWASSAQDDNSILGLILFKGENMNEDSDPLVKVMNSLDRNISIDFDGPSHYEVSVGDNKEFKRTLPAGKYKLMISAPGLKFVPDKNKVELEKECEYTLLLKRIPTGGEYK